GRPRPGGCRSGPAGAVPRCRPCARGAAARWSQPSPLRVSCQVDRSVVRLAVLGGVATAAGVLGQLDGRAVLPQPLERVVGAVLGVLHVHHDVAEVEQDPAGLRLALLPDGLGALLEQGALDGVDDRGDLALARTGRDEEDVREDELLAHVERDDLLRLDVARGARRDHGELGGALGRRHTSPPGTVAEARPGRVFSQAAAWPSVTELSPSRTSFQTSRPSTNATTTRMM